MMHMSVQRHIAIFSILMLAASCGKLPGPAGETGGTSSVRIAINSAQSTKSAKDGDIMNNLHVWIVRNDKVAAYWGGEPNAEEQEVTFEDLSKGAHTVYLVANMGSVINPDSYQVGTTIDDAFKNAMLPTLTEGNKYVPQFGDTDGMPLSLIKEVSLGAGMNDIEAQLVRVCGRLRVTIANRTKDKKIFINNVDLTGKSISTAYLFPYDHAVPSPVDSIPLPDFDTDTPQFVATGQELTLIDQYVYESLTGAQFALSLSGGLFGADYNGTPMINRTTVEEYSMTGSETNTDIEDGKYYFVCSADNTRYFLRGVDGTPEIIYENTDADLCASDDAKFYLWSFSSGGTTTTIRNYGNSLYLGYSDSNTAVLQASATSFNTNTNSSNHRLIHYQSEWFGDYYLLNNNSSLGFEWLYNTPTAAEYGWYLREAQIKEDERTSLDGAEKDIRHDDEPLEYIDRYGATAPLTHICRNEDVEIKVNVYNSDNSGGLLHIEVELWKEVSNETTFD